MKRSKRIQLSVAFCLFLVPAAADARTGQQEAGLQFPASRLIQLGTVNGMNSLEPNELEKTTVMIGGHQIHFLSGNGRQEQSHGRPSNPEVNNPDDQDQGPVGALLFVTRAVWPDGSFLEGPDPTSIEDDIGYDLLWEAGVGIGLEGHLVWENETNWMGPYFSLGWDSFRGGKHTDDFGDTMEPERLDVLSAIVGVKLYWPSVSKFFVNAEIGVGAVDYNSVDAKFTTGGVSYPVELIETSQAFTMELGLGAGYSSDAFRLDLGLALRIQGGPAPGENLLVDPGDMFVPSVELGIAFLF